jgi:murein DD-endopeptidase MepM/ murein hydrolase activator NlpD
VSIDAFNPAAMMATQSLSNPADLKNKEMGEAAEQFEGYMVEMMVREMRKTVPEGMFSSSAVDMFAGVLDQEISKSIAASGGLGFARMLGQQSSSRSMSQGQPMPVRMIQPGEGGRTAQRVDGPLPVDGVVTSGFGRRHDPFHGKGSFHKGLDIAAPSGTPIQPVRAGTVVSAGRNGGYGNVVVLDHGDGTTSMYAHCKELKVEAGDQVKLGQVIATVGTTGRSTGPHLHLEIHQHGQAVDPVEALGWSGENGQQLVSR